MSPNEWLARAGKLPGAEYARRSRRLRELLRRTGIEPVPSRREAPLRPIGAKLELTYACNLRCAFCYTDSPRRTLERATDLTDGDWERVIEEVLDVGVIEAVVSGGEPLLRSGLALTSLERLDATGVATTLTTNGWFVDETVADRLAALKLHWVNVSLDGPTPETHDRSRGVPGSWRRAVRAISLLVERGVNLRVVHVVTPDNETLLPQLFDQVRMLGVRSLRITPVVPLGAAARGGSWAVRPARLRRVIERARREHGAELDIRQDRETLSGDPVLAPGYLVVRPNGAVMAGGSSPFRFGHALEDGLATCWERIRRDWQHPRLMEWREPVLHGMSLDQLPVVMYRDDELDLYAPPAPRVLAAEALAAEAGAVETPRLPKLAASTQQQGTGDVAAAGAHVRELALRRSYRLADVRWTPGSGGSRYVSTPGGEVALLNPTASIVMDACSDGTAKAAVGALGERFREVPRERLEQDALATIRGLARRGILVSVPPV